MPVVLTYKFDEKEIEVKTAIVPNAEYDMLELLKDKEMIAPEVSRKSSGKYSPATASGLLKRLEKRGLVSQSNKMIDVYGTKFKRTVFKKKYVEISVVKC